MQIFSTWSRSSNTSSFRPRGNPSATVTSVNSFERGQVSTANHDHIDSRFNQMVSNITEIFADLKKENMVLKEEVQKLQQEGDSKRKGSRPVFFESNELPASTSKRGGLEDDRSTEEAALLTEDNQSNHLPSNAAGRWTLRCSQAVLDEKIEFFPEWPLNLQMQGRSHARASWTALQQPLQVPLQLFEEFSANVAHDRYLIVPNSYFRLTWDFLSCVMLSVQLWLTPFMLVFIPESGEPAYFSYIENCTTLFFIMDMILNFNTGVIRQVDDYDWVVMNRKAIAKDYLSFFFWVDLVSTIPFDKLVQNGQTDLFSMVRIMRTARWLKLLRFLRLTRLLKMLRWISKSFELEIERLKKQLFYPLVAFAIAAVLAHLNTCALQALMPREVLRDNMFDIYFQRLAHVLFALIAGRYIEAYSVDLSISRERLEPLWMLDLSMSIERLAMLAVAGFSLVYQAMLVLEQTVKSELIKKDVLLYMEQRKVSHKTQLQILDHFKDASFVAGVKRSYETWIAQGIPVELERTICRELWLPRLRTLGLINHVLHAKPDLQDELALIVREEALAKNNVLFTEGVLPLGAYLVLKGVLRATSSMMEAPLPFFTADMWVGEKALVSPDMPRTITCVCQTTCILMVVPSQPFRKLLLDYHVLAQFEDYCVENLWLGICGRCGMVGDHFAHECPLNGSLAMSGTVAALDDEETGFTQINADAEFEERLLADEPVPRERHTKPDLKEFLRSRRLEYLLPDLEICGVWSLLDLQELSSEDKKRIIAVAAAVQPNVDQAQLEQELSFKFIEEFKDSLEDLAKEILGTSEQRSQHLLFLSHHKVDCGTEATLLRQELEMQIQEDLQFRIMETPVFLDTENLNSLERLTEHVANTHNIVVLLSKNVLTRPWVLVEIVTAQVANVPVIPVEIRKAGHHFKYPEDKFYEDLVRGTVLSPQDEGLLLDAGISLKDVESSIRRLFNRIALPYSPHRPAVHRKLEVAQILKHCDYHPGVGERDKRRTLIRLKASSFTTSRT